MEINMKKLSATLGLFLSSTTTIYAAPNDLFLNAKNFNASHDSSALKFDFSIDAVNETIDVFDMRESEGVTDNSAGDYQGFKVSAQYDFNPQWSVEGSYWHREIEYSKDTNEIESALLAVRYTPSLLLKKNDALSFRASIWGNQADTLSKTTPTQVNRQRFEQVHVHKPEDLQLQLDAIFSRKLDPMNQLNAFAGLGYSKVEISKIDIQRSVGNCLLNININNSNQYIGNLDRPCVDGEGTIEEFSVQGDAREFGLDIQKDLNYDSYYGTLGGSWNWRYRQFESQLAYQYQRLWRKDIDDRISNFGNSPIKDNHTFGAKFSYDFTPKLTGYLQGQLFQNNLVGYVPFLYNGVTASRLDKRYGLASIGIQYHGF